MKTNCLFAIIAILAIPLLGMAQTGIAGNEADSTTITDTLSPIHTATEYVKDSNYIYADSLVSEDEFIYVTEYEEEKNWLDRAISYLLRTSVDSNYITTNDYGLMIKPIINEFTSSSTFKWNAEADTLPNSCTISSEPIIKVGVWIGYRTFGYCFSIGLSNLGKEKSKRNTELGFSWYGDAWGAEISLNKTRGSYLSFNNIDTDITNAEFTISRWQVNSYYAPLYRKFSYNAAFSHSMRQEKSAGSPLVGISMNAMKLYAKITDLPHLVNKEDLEFPSNIRYYSLNLNVGYAYNFVTKHKTLFHLSALPNFSLFKKTEVSVAEKNRAHKDPRFQWGIVGKASWIWQRENHLISIFGTVNHNNIIRDPLKVSDTVHTMGLCYGFRAYKHHRPHKKKKILKRKSACPNRQ